MRHSTRLRRVMSPHVVDLDRAGLSAVLDVSANTVASRSSRRTLFEEAGAAHRLHSRDVADTVCRARLRARNASGTRAFTVTEVRFDLFSRDFVAPSSEKGFPMIVYRP